MSMKTLDIKKEPSASELISQQIRRLTDWRGATLAELRKLIIEADPEIKEEWKWSAAVWSHAGMVCSAGVFKDHVKLNFFKGASLADSKGLFNAGLDAKASRSIDFSQGDGIDRAALKDLVCEAVALNLPGAGN